MSRGAARLSVIVVSRHRAQALRRCVRALRQQDISALELIIVADPLGIAALDGAADIKAIVFDAPNISAARNLGIGAASGEIIAFIDDDAVAEPTWARRLIAPFTHKDVVASTGFVRGRNGISYQWRACEVDSLGTDHPLECPEGVSLHQGSAQRAVKTQGTNCAFRADALRAIGGFDPAFHFFLDEADVNLRLAPLGKTAIVPEAQVHHGFLPSAQRRANRIPLSLFDIGASTAVFLRKHERQFAADRIFNDLNLAQTRRLDGFVKGRLLDGPDYARLLASLREGWAEGMSRQIGAQVALNAPPPPYRALLGCGAKLGRILVATMWRNVAHAQAKTEAEQGRIVTVVFLRPNFRAHKMVYDDGGFWIYEGGIWGRSDRKAQRIYFGRKRRRLEQILQHILAYRPGE